MKVVDINGVYFAMDLERLKFALMQRCEGSFNAFWLSHDGEDYLMLSIVVSDEWASINYLPKEFDVGFSSIGKGDSRVNAGTILFRISKSRADDLAVHADAVLSFSDALKVAQEFFHSNKLPQGIEWLQL